MTRFHRLIPLCAAAAVLVVGTLALAQAPKVVPAQPKKLVAKQPVQVRQVGPGVRRMSQPGFGYLPGYYQLRSPDTQKELELVPEQVEKLKEIAKKYQEEMQADRNAWKNWRDMTPEERKAKSAEIREKRTKRAETAKAEIEKVLLPHQIDKLKQITFRTRAPYSLRNPRTVEQLGLNEEQKAKLKKIQEEMTEQYRVLRKKAAEDALNVLTPEQKKKLEEQIQTRGY